MPTGVPSRAGSPERSRAGRAGARVGGGFTLVEVLTVIVIIGVLLSVLLVAFGGALRTGRSAQNDRTLRTIGAAVDAFKTDLGYYPPLLALDRTGWSLGGDAEVGDLAIVPDRWARGGGGEPSSANVLATLRDCRYASEYTLASYLMGAGNIDGTPATDNATGSNKAEDDGSAGPGIRDPGPDRSWGGAGGRALQTPAAGNGRAIKTGRVYGPYLDPGALSGLMQLEPRSGLFKLVDAWEQPIRYYAGWPTKNRPATGTPEPSVDFTPVELRTSAAVSHQIATGNQVNYEYEREVLNAPFAILTAGKPQLFTSASGAASRPVPLFGDRRRSTLPDPIEGLQSFTQLTQDLGSAFDPTALSADDQRNLLSDLSDNARYTP